MADAEKAQAGLAADSGIPIPRMSVATEVGFTGLRTTNGLIIEEANRVFRYPSMLKVVSEMKTDPTVSAALNTLKMLISGAKWKVKPPVNATQADINRANFIESCMMDMENTWPQFIAEVTTYLEYGFSVQEKVFRRRLIRNGSRFNDGLVGLRKIAPRSQDTIRHWHFSEDGRTLESIGQSLVNMENGARYQVLADSRDGLITIDRSKFLLFSADSVKSNPEGKSILKSVYLPYKQLTLLKDQLFLGIAKDLSAIPIVSLPPKLMDPNGSPEDVAAYQAYQTLVNNVAAGTQRGVIMPAMYDPDTRQPIFDFKLLEAKGTNKFNLPEVIKQLQNDILMALSCDVITMGADINGSFSIRDTKTNLCAMAVEHRLNEIRDVLNGDLIPQLYALNGWSQENLPTFEFGDIVDVDSEAFSKLIQRTASVGLVEVDRAVLNKIREVIGVPTKADDEPVDSASLSGATSKSGAGMEVGTTGNGTAKIGGNSSSTDASASNADNAA
jgi:hypothetical protein